jgi:hypothetical protein
MQPITVFDCIDPSQGDERTEFSYRIEMTLPIVGSRTWMNPDTQEQVWQVKQAFLYSNLGSKIPCVCLAGVAKDELPTSPAEEWADPNAMPVTISIYLLDGQYYTDSVGGGEEIRRPELGEFLEFEPGSTRLLPVDKEVTGYEIFVPSAGSKAPYPEIYVVTLQPIRVPVAA